MKAEFGVVCLACALVSASALFVLELWERRRRARRERRERERLRWKGMLR